MIVDDPFQSSPLLDERGTLIRRMRNSIDSVTTPSPPSALKVRPIRMDPWSNSDAVKVVESAAKVAESIGKLAEIGKKVSESMATVGAVSAMTGGIGGAVVAAGKILEISGAFGEKFKLDQVLDRVVGELLNNRNVTVHSAAITQRLIPNPQLGVLDAVKARLENLQTSPNQNNLDAVLNSEGDLMTAAFALMQPSNFSQILVPDEYQHHRWFWHFVFGSEMLPHIMTAAQRMQASYPDAGIVLLPEARWDQAYVPRFDYRFGIGPVVTAITTLVAVCRLREPELRSTQRYRGELKKVLNRLRYIQAGWLQSFQCTYVPLDMIERRGLIDDKESSLGWEDGSRRGWADQDRHILASAVDLCSGHSAWYEIDTVVGRDAPPEVRLDWWNQAARVRHSALSEVMQDSGYADFADLVNSVEALLAPPDSTETVVVSNVPNFASLGVGQNAGRGLGTAWSDVPKPGKRTVTGVGGARDFDRTLRAKIGGDILSLSITKQPVEPEANEVYVIPYRFAVNGRTIPLGRSTLQLDTRHFELLRGPGGERQVLAAGIKPVALECVLQQEDNHFSLSVVTPPGVNINILLSVEETVFSGKTVLSTHALEALTLMEFLPAEYWEWRWRNMMAEVQLAAEVRRQLEFDLDDLRPEPGPQELALPAYLDKVKTDRPKVFGLALKQVRANAEQATQDIRAVFGR